MTDAMKAVGQDVQKEAPDELMASEAHEASASAAAVVPVGERNACVVDGREPGIGDGGAVRIAGKIGEHALGSAEGRLGVDDERALAQGAHALGEGAGVCQRGQIAEEAEFAAAEGGGEAIKEEPAERLRQSVNGQQEVRLAADPAPAIEGDAAARNEAVDMRVMGDRLSPGMQHRDQAEPGGQAPDGERHERLGRCAHQEAVDSLLVLESDLGSRRRQGEDDVEIGNRQQLRLTSRQPLRSRRPLTLRTMAVSARVVGDAGKPAVTALDVAAERRRAARRDRADHAPLDAPEMSGVRPFVSLAMVAEDVGQFERRPRRHPLSRRRHLQRQSIQRTGGLGDDLRRDARVARRRRQILVAEQNLNDADVDAALQEVGGEAVT
jgi:hypothetical protein